MYCCIMAASTTPIQSLPAVGSKAPDFSLEDKDGKTWSLKSIKASYIVLFFYPKDSTIGCTLEARDFSSKKAQFDMRGITVIGISGGDAASKQKFCDDNKLTVPMISDTDFAVSKAYGIYGEKSFMGKKYLGIGRTTFVIDGDKKIVAVFENVNPAGHASAVFAKVASLSSESSIKSR